MTTDLYELADCIETEEDFLEFIDALLADRIDENEEEKAHPGSPHGPGVNGWENRSIAAFLCAAGAWAESSKNGLAFYDKPSNPWKRAAHILHAGKFYE